MIERSFEERARLSAPCVRTFVNIARRWQLTERQQAQLLAADIATLRGWATAATQHRDLVLETETLMRLSVVLGVFADLRQFLTAISGAREERTWLLRQQPFSPFNGRTPLEALCGDFEEQMTVRRHLAAIAANADASAVSELEHLPHANYDFLDTRFAMTAIQGVCFDGFGTLVEITDKRRPFQSLIAGEPSNSLAHYAMKHPVGLRELSQQLSTPISEGRLAELEADLSAELNSVRQRSGMDRVWEAVQRAGLRTAVCSNLTEPYEKPLLEKLPGKPDAVVLSSRAQLIKPQPEIYHLVCSQLGLDPCQVLFVGDADVAPYLPSFITGLCSRCGPSWTGLQTRSG